VVPLQDIFIFGQATKRRKGHAFRIISSGVCDVCPCSRIEDRSHEQKIIVVAQKLLGTPCSERRFVLSGFISHMKHKIVIDLQRIKKG